MSYAAAASRCSPVDPRASPRVIRLVLRHVLGCDYETLHINPCRSSGRPWCARAPEAGLIALLYAANTPLTRRGLQDLFLPLLDDAFGVLPGYRRCNGTTGWMANCSSVRLRYCQTGTPSSRCCGSLGICEV